MLLLSSNAVPSTTLVLLQRLPQIHLEGKMDSQASAKFTALACRVSGFTVGFALDQGREEREGEEEFTFIMGSSKSPK